MENASFHPNTRRINFHDTSLTPNSRTSFPLNYLPDAHIPATGPHPTNIIFLTCDTKGVLPPVAKLTHQQAYYQFLSGYTAKVGGTDLTTKTPESTFSSCFGEIFLPLHPAVYGQMFYEKIKKHNVNVWLVNTGYMCCYVDGLKGSMELARESLSMIHFKLLTVLMMVHWRKLPPIPSNTSTLKFPQKYPELILI